MATIPSVPPASGLAAIEALIHPAAGASQTFAATITPISTGAPDVTGVGGSVTASLQGDTLTVTATITGLLPEASPELAITAPANGSPATLPPASGETELNLAQASVGQVILDLSANPATTLLEGPGHHADAVAPMTDGTGALVFTQSYSFDPTNPAEAAVLQALGSLAGREVVVVGGVGGAPTDPTIDPNLVVGAGLFEPVSAETHPASAGLMG